MNLQPTSNRILPALCNETRLPAKTIAVLRDVWVNSPRLKRSQSSLPASEWESSLNNCYHCFISIPGGNIVLLPGYGRCSALNSADTPHAFRQFSNLRTFSIYLNADDSDLVVPDIGATLNVSKICGYADLWATLVAGLFIELKLGQTHTVETLKSNGLTFTYGYVNEVDHWICCTVLAVHQSTQSVELLAEIQSVVWNQPLDVE